MPELTALDRIFMGVEAAMDSAYTAHVDGTCSDSEWSCSYCEGEAR